MTELEGSLVNARAAMLQKYFESVKDGAFAPLPHRSVWTGDWHLGPVMNATGMRERVLEFFLSRSWGGSLMLGGDIDDIWREPHLKAVIVHTDDARILGNHEWPDYNTLPPFKIFKGYGIKVFWTHGHIKADSINDTTGPFWKLAREAVRIGGNLHLDPSLKKLAPAPTDPHRHDEVLEAYRSLAQAYPDWTFIFHHLHEVVNEGNLLNPSAPITGRLQYVYQEEDHIEIREA